MVYQDKVRGRGYVIISATFMFSSPRGESFAYSISLLLAEDIKQPKLGVYQMIFRLCC